MKVNPNRMELLKLKKKLKVASRGHKLLKEKFDELMKNFFNLVKKDSILRKEINEDFKIAYSLMSIARCEAPLKVIEDALSNPKMKTEINHSFKTLLNIDIPVFEAKSRGELSYSLISTPASLDEALINFKELIPKLIELAQLEKSIQLLAVELEKTRRRVNALEYVLIPQLKSSTRFITMKLDEVERDAHTRAMKIKEMV